MALFLLRRIAAAIPVLLGVSIFAFSMSHLVPGDPIAIMLGERATAADIARLREQLGLDEPIHVQYGRYVERAVQGDLGRSIRSGQPVSREIGERIGSTAQLTAAAMFIALSLGMTMGVLAAISRSPWGESLAMSVALLGLSMPNFWFGLLLILVFSVHLGWLPALGSDSWAGLILPAITLALPAAAVLARMTRSSMLEVLDQDFVRTARSKGVSERSVVLRHGLRMALIPIVTIIGLQIGGLMAGSVIVESVFARPGLGRYAVEAILARDFPVIQGTVLVAGVIYVVVNMLTDLLYGLLDPRIQMR